MGQPFNLLPSTDDAKAISLHLSSGLHHKQCGFPVLTQHSGRAIAYSGVITDHNEAGTVLDAGKTKRNRVYSTLKELKFQEKKHINEDKF